MNRRLRSLGQASIRFDLFSRSRLHDNVLKQRNVGFLLFARVVQIVSYSTTGISYTELITQSNEPWL